MDAFFSKVTPTQCVKLLIAAGHTIEDIQNTTSITRQRLYRIRSGQNSVDYKAADALRSMLYENRDSLEELTALASEIKGDRL